MESNFKRRIARTLICGFILFVGNWSAFAQTEETTGGWAKYAGNPLPGLSYEKYGTIFDISVLKEDGTYRMWVSWRSMKCIALVESVDGIHWSDPVCVLSPDTTIGLDDDPDAKWLSNLNRPVVLKKDNVYHLWFTGQQPGGLSRIGYATSPDGVQWTIMNNKQPVLTFEPGSWEDQPTQGKSAVMCPHVIWDANEQVYKMWYSAGDSWEPLAIGHATSADGINWTKNAKNPIFISDKSKPYEAYGVGACQVIKNPWGEDGTQGYLMLYISYRDIKYAQISMAFSENGTSDWVRYENNPIIRPSQNGFDASACYKPYAILDGTRWMLWYNGRNGMENGVDSGRGPEQMALATHEGADLGFPNQSIDKK